MNTRSTRAALAIGAAALAIGAWWWLRPTAAPPPAEPKPVAEVAPAPAPALTASAVRYPIDAVAVVGDEPVDAEQPPTLESMLAALVGREVLLRFVQTGDFARRFAATVDNLGRAHAPAERWPVLPTPGRFDTVVVEGREIVGAANAARYDAFVRLVGSVDPARAVALYLRLYPQLQAAYEDLGYPGRAFNDRVVNVIDLLLATPDAPVPLPVQLTEVRGPIPSTRPWVRYEFADPALEDLAAGQKVLLRVGPAHAAALKAWLVQVRALLAGGAVPR